MGVCETKNNQKPNGNNSNVNGNTNTKTNITNNAQKTTTISQVKTPLPQNSVRNTDKESNNSNNNSIVANNNNSNIISANEENSVKKQYLRMFDDKSNNANKEGEDRGQIIGADRKASLGSVENEDSVGYNQTRNTQFD